MQTSSVLVIVWLTWKVSLPTEMRRMQDRRTRPSPPRYKRPCFCCFLDWNDQPFFLLMQTVHLTIISDHHTPTTPWTHPLFRFLLRPLAQSKCLCFVFLFLPFSFSSSWYFISIYLCVIYLVSLCIVVTTQVWCFYNLFMTPHLFNIGSSTHHSSIKNAMRSRHRLQSNSKAQKPRSDLSMPSTALVGGLVA